MEISRTKVKLQLRRKTSQSLVETIRLALGSKAWLPLAKRLSSPSAGYSAVNLFDIESNSSVGDTILVPGKVLSSGDVTKKIRVCALSFSKQAREKLKTSKSEIVLISEEIKKNPKAEGIKILQ